MLQVLALQVGEGVDRGRVHLDQAQHELGGEARRGAGFFLCSSLADLQELVGPLRWASRVLDQEEFLLEPDPSIQQPVPFAQPTPERQSILSTFLGTNSTPGAGIGLWPEGKKSGGGQT